VRPHKLHAARRPVTAVTHEAGDSLRSVEPGPCGRTRRPNTAPHRGQRVPKPEANSIAAASPANASGPVQTALSKLPGGRPSVRDMRVSDSVSRAVLAGNGAVLLRQLKLDELRPIQILFPCFGWLRYV
jgi:hypothetical protein